MLNFGEDVCSLCLSNCLVYKGWFICFCVFVNIFEFVFFWYCRVFIGIWLYLLLA